MARACVSVVPCSDLQMLYSRCRGESLRGGRFKPETFLVNNVVLLVGIHYGRMGLPVVLLSLAGSMAQAWGCAAGRAATQACAPRRLQLDEEWTNFVLELLCSP